MGFDRGGWDEGGTAAGRCPEECLEGVSEVWEVLELIILHITLQYPHPPL